jgi:hypothetical protein
MSSVRREAGMADPALGQFRWTGTRTGQVGIRARIPRRRQSLRGPVSVVSLQRLSSVWYILGVRTSPSPNVVGEIAFRRPSGSTGSLVLPPRRAATAR